MQRTEQGHWQSAGETGVLRLLLLPRFGPSLPEVRRGADMLPPWRWREEGLRPCRRLHLRVEQPRCTAIGPAPT